MNIELDYSKLGKRIKEQRLKQHLTQEKLGETVNVAAAISATSKEPLHK